MPEIPALDPASPKKVSFTRPLIFILALAGLFIVARAFNLQEYLQEDRLRRFIAAGGMWGPFIFLLVWAIVPTLFLPCLPITLAGGVLFGPVWGVVYTAIGATGRSFPGLPGGSLPGPGLGGCQNQRLQADPPG